MAFVDDLGAALDKTPGGGIILTSLDAVMDWSRGKSLWMMPMGTACCAMELIAASFSRVRLRPSSARFRGRTRGTPTSWSWPARSPGRWRRRSSASGSRCRSPSGVIAMGNCAVSGGIFYYDTYSVIRGVDEFLPVDVYISGCPPRPEALQDAILRLREQVKSESIVPSRTRPIESILPQPGSPRKGDAVDGGDAE